MIEIILATLASYRIARILATEEGPFGLFVAIRERFDPEQNTWLGRGLNCSLCIGFWVSFVVTCLLPFVSIQSFLLLWWAIAGLQTIVHLLMQRIEL